MNIKEHIKHYIKARPKLFKIYLKLALKYDYAKSNILFFLKERGSIREIKKFKNIHKGKRCFIVGNGPSLKGEDLEKLKGEITFAANRIDPIFKETTWRPTYYCAFDDGFIKDTENHRFIESVDCEMKFFRKQGYYYSRSIKDKKTFLKSRYSEKYLDTPKFSEDISKYIYTIGTVTYVSIQIAIYMGIREIYFIGVDNSYANERKKDGTLVKNENSKNYFGDEKINEGFSAVYQMDIAYEAAKKYADKNKIEIYNATRGGKLEIFERRDFDKLFI